MFVDNQALYRIWREKSLKKHNPVNGKLHCDVMGNDRMSKPKQKRKKFQKKNYFETHQMWISDTVIRDKFECVHAGEII